MIEFESVTRQFGDFKAVQDLSFRVERGTGITALLGPNGAGKSTTLRLLTGYLRASSGKIQVNGMSMDDPENAVEIKRSIGYLPESSPLYPEMLVSEFLAFIGGVRGLAPELLEKRVVEMTERLELGSHFYSPIGILSKGFRQRVALAGSLIHDPRIIVLDEPTSGLDPNQIAHIRQIIRELGKDRTVILSTHIMQEVEDLCDRVIVISRGSIVADRSMDELQGEEAKVKLTVKAGREKVATALEGIGAGLISDAAAESEPEDGFQKYIIQTRGKSPEELFRFVANQDWEVRSFTPAVRSLQEIFHELTG